ncbi:hypothetical protein PV328_000135 [Microctonus aethiopoides]|uniref:Uncharacterized protein n=1 Tax=Microctonus aethiopoides TaxID=144406 RepID=A0AA39KWA1_9HYME|nr:hypothetical protein PV328_000135 [Microctonus aethiopoides]
MESYKIEANYVQELDIVEISNYINVEIRRKRKNRALNTLSNQKHWDCHVCSRGCFCPVFRRGIDGRNL